MTPTAEKPKEIISINPATGEEVGRIQGLGADEVRARVASARQAFVLWSRTSFAERAEMVLKMRRYLLDHIDEIAEIISKDNGKPRLEALSSEIYPICDLMSWFADNTARLLKPKPVGIGVWNLFLRRSVIHYDPMGVVGVISPWNYPFSIPLGEIVMALMAGNCVVHKASSSTPFVGKAIADVVNAGGLPDGVFHDLPGSSAVGTAMIDAKVDKILFTGSVGVGRKIMEMAAKHLTPVSLELGGKDPMIVLADADLDVASSGAVWGAFCNSGQTCASVERVYVQEPIAEEFIRLVVEKTKALRQGCGPGDDCDVGSMTTEGQLKEVEEQMEDARKRGAKILTGGERDGSRPGWFYKPTVLTHVDHGFRCVMEETFGPTMPIMTFKDEDEAVRLANDSPFGLTASVWTRMTSRGFALARRIRAGTVTINDCVFTHGVCQTPWGGPGDSGIGRTHSYMGLMEVVEPHHIHVNPLTFQKNFWWYPYGGELYGLLKSLTRTLTKGGWWGILQSVPNLIRIALIKKR
ncbi:MAG: aldehyde dehydrogenase family protein [Elusimicrobiota bacterium]